MLDAIGNIAEFFGALGVIASLAYLGVHVRQNTKSSRAAAQQSAMAQFVDFSFRLAEDEALAVLLRKWQASWLGPVVPRGGTPEEGQLWTLPSRHSSGARFLSRRARLPGVQR